MTLPRPAVRRAGTADAQTISRILSSGFTLDPPLMWIIPDPAERAALSPAFFAPFAELVTAEGHAYVTEDGTGAALWLDVDVNDPPADDGGALHQRLTETIGAANAQRFAVLDAIFSANHPDHESHAYLVFVGVLATEQGQGIGSDLLATHLAELDAAGRPAYLEASSQRNAVLYRKHGFTQVNQGIALPDGPTLYPMWRDVSPPHTSI